MLKKEQEHPAQESQLYYGPAYPLTREEILVRVAQEITSSTNEANGWIADHFLEERQQGKELSIEPASILASSALDPIHVNPTEVYPALPMPKEPVKGVPYLESLITPIELIHSPETAAKRDALFPEGLERLNSDPFRSFEPWSTTDTKTGEKIYTQSGFFKSKQPAGYTIEAAKDDPGSVLFNTRETIPYDARRKKASPYSYYELKAFRDGRIFYAKHAIDENGTDAIYPCVSLSASKDTFTQMDIDVINEIYNLLTQSGNPRRQNT